jgi:hypothetical protein
VGKLNAREIADRAKTRRKAGLKAAQTRKSKPRTPSLEQLLCPLTPTQEAGIIEALIDDAPQFLKDWNRISAVGYHYANERRKNAQASRKGNQKERAQEAKSVDTALKALSSLEKQLETFEEHWQQHWVPIWKRWHPYDNHDNPEFLVHAMQEVVLVQLETVGGYGTERGILRKGQLGQPIIATRYFLEVVLAYFRDRQWDAAIPLTDLSTDTVLDYDESDFVQVAFVLLGHTNMRPPTRRALAESSLNYAAFEKDAPVLSPAQRAQLVNGR